MHEKAAAGRPSCLWREHDHSSRFWKRTSIGVEWTGLSWPVRNRSIHADHNVRGFDYCGNLAARLKAEFVGGFHS
jgi:hypothetical protein